MFIKLLVEHNPSGQAPTTATLETVFSALEQKRIPRCAKLVKQARLQGESRVVEGVEGGLKRNAAYREIWKDVESVQKHMGHLYED